MEVSAPNSNGPRGKVLDKEDANQRERLRAVQHAWDAAIERRTDAEDAVISGTDSEMVRRHIYRVGVERLLLEIESLAERTGDMGRWENKHLGTVVIPVPEAIQRAFDGRSRLLGSGQPEPEQVQVVGLVSMLDQQWPVRKEFEVIVAGGRRGRPQRISEVSVAEPSIHILDNCMRETRKMLGEAGLDLELGGDISGADDEEDWL